MHDINAGNSHTISQQRVHQLLVLEAESVPDLRGRIACVADLVNGSAGGDLTELAADLARALDGRPVRAAVVASSADQAAERLARLAVKLDGGASIIDVSGGIFAAQADGRPAIGFLFPGQGSGRGGTDGGILAQRFETVRQLYRSIAMPADAEPATTSTAQPRIVAASVAGLRLLTLLGIEGSVAAGHSLGELTALHWAGGMNERTLLDLACTRGQIMADASDGGGAMAGIAASSEAVDPLLRGEPVVIAGYNGPHQTVIAGPADAVTRVRQAATAAGLKATPIPVADAFHSPAMAPAADGLRSYLGTLSFRRLSGRVASTITGGILAADTDLRQLLVRQLCEPVLFSRALSLLAAESTLLIEVGPGRVLSGLAARICPGVPVVPLATDASSLSGLLSAAAAAFVLGTPIRHDRLSADQKDAT